MEVRKIVFNSILEIFHSILASSLFHTKISVPFHSIFHSISCSGFLFDHSKLTSPKIQTFAYNSRTIRFCYTKCWQQFEINELYVCAKFWGNRFRDFGFKTRKPFQKFDLESGPIQKRLKYAKKYFTWLNLLRYRFIPTNPILATMSFFSFLSS